MPGKPSLTQNVEQGQCLIPISIIAAITVYHIANAAAVIFDT